MKYIKYFVGARKTAAMATLRSEFGQMGPVIYWDFLERMARQYNHGYDSGSEPDCCEFLVQQPFYDKISEICEELQLTEEWLFKWLAVAKRAGILDYDAVPENYDDYGSAKPTYLIITDLLQPHLARPRKSGEKEA